MRLAGDVQNPRKDQEDPYEGLAGKEALNKDTDEDNPPWDLEAIACGTQFREAQWEEPTLQPIWETEVTRCKQQVV